MVWRLLATTGSWRIGALKCDEDMKNSFEERFEVSEILISQLLLHFIAITFGIS